MGDRFGKQERGCASDGEESRTEGAHMKSVKEGEMKQVSVYSVISENDSLFN